MAASIPTVSWSDWVHESGNPRLPLLILLPENLQLDGIIEQTRSHDPSRVVVSIPLAELRERSFELPPRNVEFSVLVENESSREMALEFLVPSPLKKQQQKPWNVSLVVFMKSNEGQTTTTNPNLELREQLTDESSVPDPPAKFLPLHRLWQPDPMVELMLLPILLSKLNNASLVANTKQPTCYEIWDLGAGSGRDVCFLAEQLKAHVVDPSIRFRVVAIDQRYRSREATDTLERFWSRRNVAQETECRRMDLDNVSNLLDAMAERERAGCIVLCLFAVRFCNKALIRQILHKSNNNDKSNDNGAVLPPLLFATSHFCRPHVGALWNFEHPKPHHVLERHELRDMFQTTNDTWNILNDEIASDTDHGRTLIQFVAERPT